MSLADRAIPLLEALLEEVQSLMRDLQFGHDRQHLVAAALLATVMEISVGISSALRAGNGTSAFILSRSLLEAYVDLLNVVQDPEYVAYMEAAFRDQQHRILVSVVERGSQSPFLASLVGNAGTAKKRLDQVRLRLRELRSHGVEPLSVKDRFERAKQQDYYEGPYANLCWHSHNNINILEQRHLRQDDERVSLVVGASLNEDDVKIITDTTAGMAANSVAAVKELVQSGQLSGLENLGRRLNALRELWKGST